MAGLNGIKSVISRFKTSISSEKKPDITIKPQHTYVTNCSVASFFHEKPVFEKVLLITDKDENIPDTDCKICKYSELGSPLLSTLSKYISDFVSDNSQSVVILDGFNELSKEISQRNIATFVEELATFMINTDSSLIFNCECTEDHYLNIKQALAASYFHIVIGIISNPIRLGVLEQLGRKGKTSFTDLMNELNLTKIPPKLSFHLNSMKKSGVLAQDEDKQYYLEEFGKTVSYSIANIEKAAFNGNLEIQTK